MSKVTRLPTLSYINQHTSIIHKQKHRKKGEEGGAEGREGGMEGERKKTKKRLFILVQRKPPDIWDGCQLKKQAKSS